MLQTIYIPFDLLINKGIDISKILRLEFVFDIVSSGTIYLDDIQLTKIDWYPTRPNKIIDKTQPPKRY